MFVILVLVQEIRIPGFIATNDLVLFYVFSQLQETSWSVHQRFQQMASTRNGHVIDHALKAMLKCDHKATFSL